MVNTAATAAEGLEMFSRPSVRTLLDDVRETLRVSDTGAVELVSADALRATGIDQLVRAAVFGVDEDTRDTARWLILRAGHAVGIAPASIHDLYTARGRGDVAGFTVPAINVRAASFDTGRALFRAAKELRVGALICEIARSEIGYTDQRPAEYVSVMIAAAVKEGWSGPLFIQGDHFQVNAKKYKADPEPELQAVKDIIREGMHAGFYNIDIDTSTLVDLDKDGLDAQQELNYRLSAELTAYVRKHEPAGITVSIGGEIGEVGTENSTPEELRAYMDGYNRELARVAETEGRPVAGLSKISVQSGTTHGGTVLPDGSIQDVAIDFETLRNLSEIARREYGMSGAVQHGASTLPQTAFGNFPTVETAEIHLATNFQNLLYDAIPDELRDRMYEHTRKSFPEERKPSDTEEQFIYKARKKAIGAFKRELWDLPEADRERIRAVLYDQFTFLFRQLRVEGTMDAVAKHVPLPEIHRTSPADMRMKAAEDDWDLSD
ncbi:class II fructose-bisphosphate aldolase [Longimicrobium terrae]|uniref:Fructose/tagatose bisphosphate aldolase n=1 Tax=Longimicrobium terrae TaxID=1639882 RepID=A0A841GRU0_9BACT|nr:class II fructose-bisphosphate aldolase [Longimicrobium terrae]MBB4634101.1 fructose/tagatose bisphosphate aldolase [Longimicrobium terrae]MBB6069009.1 fructose/tagatose bisphosphate aldolase [Longimicrobium terrae]